MRKQPVLFSGLVNNVLTFFVLFLNCSFFGIAQVNIDSLKTIWNDGTKHDTIRLIALDKLIKKDYLYSHPDSSFYYSQLMYDFAKTKDYKMYMAEAKNMQGISLMFQGKYSLAHEYFMVGLKLNQEIDYKLGVSLTYTDIGNNYKDQGDYENALKYYNLSLKIDKELGDKESISKSYNNIGIIYKKYGDYDKAIEYHKRGLPLKKEIGDVKGEAYSYINLGVNYYEKGNYVSAIDYYMKGLSLVEDIGDKRAMSSTLNNIALIYKNQKDYPNALKYHNWSLRIKEQMGDKKGITASLNNLGLMYNEIDEYHKAFTCLNRSLQINTEIGEKEGIATSLNNIGNVYNKQGDYLRANEFYMRSLAKMEKVGEKGRLAKILADIGENYYELGDYKSAILYSSRALNQAQEIKKIIEAKRAAKTLYLSYKKLGKLSKALSLYELYIAKKDSIDSKENQRAVIRQEYKYAYEKKAAADSVAFVKEQEVKDALIQVRDAKIEKSKIQQIALYGCLVSLTAFLLFVYSRYRLTSRQKSIIADQNVDIINAMEQLKRSQSQYKALFSSLPDALLVFNDEGVINDCNDVAVVFFGKNNKEELIGSTYVDLSAKDRLNNKKHIQLQDVNSAELITVETSSFEYLITNGKVKELPVLVSMCGMQVGGKNQVFALIRDISEIKSYQKELEMSKIDLEQTLTLLKSTHEELKLSKDRLSEMNKRLEERVAERTLELETANKKLISLDKAKSQFLNIISHEIRTPLNGIVGGLKLLKESKLSEEAESLIEILDLSANRLEDFSTKALDISLISLYDKDVLKFKEVSIIDIVEDVVEKLISEGLDKEVRFDTQFVADRNRVLVDYKYLSKSLQNIIHNAVKFSSDKGMVTVQVDNSDTAVVVTVKDEGIGFEQDFLVDEAIAFNNENHEDANPGVGLFLANQIIKAHGGYMENGNNVDKGAFVKVFIPIHD